MSKITLQCWLKNAWHDAAVLTVQNPEQGRSGSAELEYLPDYVARFIDIPAAQLGFEYPVDFFPHQCDHWPAFLLDIFPLGAARRVICLRIGLSNPGSLSHDFQLLRDHCPSPVGNVRVKESVSNNPAPAIGFPMEDVLKRDTNFLDYARDHGATIGGATGAGGEAPKLLVSLGNDGLYYPSGSIDESLCREHFLVKFPRHSSSLNDQIILEAEARYYQILDRMSHLESINTDPDGLPSIFFAADNRQGISKPSLWLKRFDANAGQRVGLESLYSLQGVIEPGQTVQHLDYLNTLCRYWTIRNQETHIPKLVSDYIKRDLLNVVLGNTDNHGRNTAILKTDTDIQLAPVYDLAPMCMDSEGMTRTSRWGSQELGGNFDWHGICDDAATVHNSLSSEDLWQSLQDFTRDDLIHIPELAREYKLPESVCHHPGINLNGLEKRLQNWGLL